MWVFASGMFRSGSTLQFQLVSALIERAGLGHRMPWAMPEDFAEIAIEHDENPELLVFKTHICKHPMRERLRDGRALAIGAHRDLRDVAVSGAQKAGVEPTPAYCKELMTGCMACARGWEGSPGILEQSYALLTRDPKHAVLEMAGHLQIPCSETHAEALSQEFSVDRQRERIAKAVRDGRMRSPRPGGKILHMDRELLHPNHIVDGQTGKWRDVLSPESIRVIEEIGADWLAFRGYELTTDRSQVA